MGTVALVMRTPGASFQEDLQQVQVDVTRLATFVTEMLSDAMQALVEQDQALADKVILDDEVADEIDLQVEQECMRLLALEQPRASDLRTIATAMKVLADYERIGDYAVDIAKSAKTLADEHYFKALVDIPRMGELTVSMSEAAARSFVDNDLELVQKVIETDNEVERIWYHLLDELIDRMSRDPEIVPQATHLLLVARYLERCADHVVNIAERVAYMTTGHSEDLADSHRPGHERPPSSYDPNEDLPDEKPDPA